jgi:hypothetical protein
MLLSRDASVSRKRRQTASNWLIGSAIVVSGVFIAASSAHMSNLTDAKVKAEQERDDLRTDLAKVSAERDYYMAANEWLRVLASTVSDDDDVEKVIQLLPQPAHAGAQVLAQPPVNNIVWIVDGSRRYPVKTNDILWIPEAQMWLRVEVQQTRTPSGEVQKRSTVFRFEGPRPAPDEEGEEITDLPHYFEFPRNASRCIRLDVHKDSIRPGFGGDYVDIEVLYFTPGPGQPCGNGE